MTQNRNIIDLSVGFSFPHETMSFIKKFFSINVMGIYDNRLLAKEKDTLVLRIQNTKQGIITTQNDYFFLYYQDFQENLDNTYGNTDILTINDFFNPKNLLKKLSGKNIGFEFLVSKLRYLDISQIGRWFSYMKYFYGLCKRYRHQLILSSGAKNIYELLSLRIINSILDKLDVSSTEYWSDLNQWLSRKKRGMIYDPL
ncbi:hypothetical protein [Candidatus Nitrosocosmicus arcticus]|uniref:RNase P subunit p30 n=1 Tax=Candidatus Nitrosocosmicus arcticus TaxID=2035267 RepID=A0A557SSQ8_9ARCH|nr:hypothetical protein [Candidatus Nitrosocosmicus arcticus]TVP39630.1 hypothetical protein NARC_140085 [Candidatus Nitrosocosmicus arcticus]